jgi:hypothetical protein
MPELGGSGKISGITIGALKTLLTSKQDLLFRWSKVLSPEEFHCMEWIIEASFFFRTIKIQPKNITF